MDGRAPIAFFAVLLTVVAVAPAQDLPTSSRLSCRDIIVSLRDVTAVRGYHVSYR
jgi:hypothetical protein